MKKVILYRNGAILAVYVFHNTKREDDFSLIARKKKAEYSEEHSIPLSEIQAKVYWGNEEDTYLSDHKLIESGNLFRLYHPDDAVDSQLVFERLFYENPSKSIKMETDVFNRVREYLEDEYGTLPDSFTGHTLVGDDNQYTLIPATHRLREEGIRDVMLNIRFDLESVI